jgi:arsenate reductase
MKILFVCRQNVGRSQMAKAFYNHLTHSHDADAAGTHVPDEGQTLLERKAASSSKNFFVLDVMKDSGIDMSEYKRRALTENDLQRYDRIISMAKREDTPQWLLKSAKYVQWEVKDPRGQNYAKTAEARDNIKQKVADLIKEQ